ncbi:zinc finger protein 513-like [Hemiscyllium ocellatum]|uniref:zinc finger protein 513-like n=1 Tax=Hemiscyllium ocellatum TaxID=170820 RepID=UPI002965D7D0|nr:zinc finger protein 513-like [Hemiscyllium ocellatum]
MSGESALPSFADQPPQQEEEEVKPLMCALCPFVTQNDEDMRVHRTTHSQPGPPLQAPGPVKREVPIEWWAPCDGETSEGSDGGLCPRGAGAYTWDPGQERSWLFEESQDGGGPRGRAGEEEEEEGEEDVNYKVVVVGEDGKGGSAPRPPGGPEGEPDSESGHGGGSPNNPGARPTQGTGPNKQRWQSKQYQCDLCPYVAGGKQELRTHERETHLREGSDVIKCSQCNYTTNKISFWRQHKLVHVSTSGSPGRIYMCKTCGWKTKYRHSLVKHIALHTGNKSFQCDQCGFACARKENLKRHKLTHLKKGVDGKGLLLKCNWCEYSTAHSNALRRHAMTLHNADENYVPEYHCDLCEFKTTKLSNFSNHKITHLYGYMMVHVNQSGPLRCSLCPFVSDHWDCLQEHQRTHKELRCIQDTLGSGPPGAQEDPAMSRLPGVPGPGVEGGEAPHEVGGAAGEAGAADDEILALGKIIGTIGEYVNGSAGTGTDGEIEYCGTSYRSVLEPTGQAGDQVEVEQGVRDWQCPDRATVVNGVETSGRTAWRRRRRAVPTASPTPAPCSGWEGVTRPGPARHGPVKRLRCGQCRFTCHNKERLRRHTLTHSRRRTPDTGGRAQNPALDTQPETTPGGAAAVPSPHLAVPEGISCPVPQSVCPVPEPAGVGSERTVSVQEERLLLEKERLQFEKEKWKVEQGLLALQQRKLQLQVLLLERQLNIVPKTSPPT